jgi:acid phosphatase
MTTLLPRGPYSQEELRKLYPEGLQLQLVQVLLRHGERSPVSARFQNAGLRPFWPYCTVARQMVSATMDAVDSKWTPLQWRRRLETFGNDDGPVLAAGPLGEVDAVCNLGELTDIGRKTTWELGRRLRHLYVHQLHFMPSLIRDADMFYLRATPIPRALESLQQTFWGMYPSNTRTASFPPLTIVTRAPADETLFPNDGNCRRFAQLSRAFAQRTADRWNNTDEMEYLNKLISKWMPESSKRVAVDSHPRLSGIMDTINSTLAHGPETRLPNEFYDAKGLAIIEKIGVEEWFSGYQESQEYRSLGIGGLMGDVVSRMVGSVEMNGNDGLLEIGGKDGSSGRGRGGEKAIKMALSGCHDTTLAAVLASLGAFEGKPWPPYTSHIALELFRKSDLPQTRESAKLELDTNIPFASHSNDESQKGWLRRIFSNSSRAEKDNGPVGIARHKVEELTDAQRSKLDGYFVRIRYNDEVMKVPGCKTVGKHLDGDDSFCTLVSLKNGHFDAPQYSVVMHIHRKLLRRS